MKPANDHLSMNVGVSDTMLSFISTFADKREMEIVTIFAAWLSNGCYGEGKFLKTLICDVMKTSCREYITTCDNLPLNDGSLFRSFSNKHFAALVQKTKNVLSSGSLIEAYNNCVNDKRKRCKYAHDAFAELFGGGTMFDTRKAKSTFYRYNLIPYWLHYKLGIWSDYDTSKALLPCNDVVFEGAKRLGVTHRVLRSNLKSAIQLTEKAKLEYGNNDFYKLYEQCLGIMATTS